MVNMCTTDATVAESTKVGKLWLQEAMDVCSESFCQHLQVAGCDETV